MSLNKGRFAQRIEFVVKISRSFEKFQWEVKTILGPWNVYRCCEINFRMNIWSTQPLTDRKSV